MKCGASNWKAKSSSPRLRLLLGEPAVHADHLERLLLQVVGLLRVEGQDLVGHLVLGDQDRGHRSALSLARAVRRWWPLGVQ